MSSYQTYTIEPTLQLSQDALADVRQLVAACEAEDRAPVRVSWSMLQERSGAVPLDFCCYLAGRLVGYLFMDHYDPKERETVILVHPAYRRRGIAHALLVAAHEQCRRAGIERIILICERRAISGKAFADHFAARFDFAEHEMVLGDFRPRAAHTSHLSLRLATLDDLDVLVAIQASSFDEPEDDVRQRFIRHWQEPSSKQYIATLAAEQTEQAVPVGALRLTAEDRETGIYGLGVAPAYQGRGYGRQIIEEAIRLARLDDPQQPVMLDVDESNTRAFNLYRSCGFQVRATYDYYTLMTGLLDEREERS
ncbi:MAG TPA: GNAT family N-acetyltransferase [Ktedonobacterales bacterium]